METTKSSPGKNTILIDNYGYNVEGVTKADQGHFDEALHYFNKAIETDPENYVAYFNRASIKMRLGDIEGARKDFKVSENLDKNSNVYS
jgi:Flp pilus assembly protein TadD